MLLVLLLSCYVVADEYLIPEDWDKKETAPRIDLTISLNDFSKRISKNLKDYPQCSSFKLSKAKLFNDGNNALQELIINNALLEITTTITNNKKLAYIQISSHGNAKNDLAMRAMVCATYASARSIQPSYGTKQSVLDQATFLWKTAIKEPFEIGFELGKIKAQYTPFQLTIYPNN